MIQGTLIFVYLFCIKTNEKKNTFHDKLFENNWILSSKNKTGIFDFLRE